VPFVPAVVGSIVPIGSIVGSSTDPLDFVDLVVLLDLVDFVVFFVLLDFVDFFFFELFFVSFFDFLFFLLFDLLSLSLFLVDFFFDLLLSLSLFFVDFVLYVFHFDLYVFLLSLDDEDELFFLELFLLLSLDSFLNRLFLRLLSDFFPPSLRCWRPAAGR